MLSFWCKARNCFIQPAIAQCTHIQMIIPSFGSQISFYLSKSYWPQWFIEKTSFHTSNLRALKRCLFIRSSFLGPNTVIEVGCFSGSTYLQIITKFKWKKVVALKLRTISAKNDYKTSKSFFFKFFFWSISDVKCEFILFLIYWYVVCCYLSATSKSCSFFTSNSCMRNWWYVSWSMPRANSRRPASLGVTGESAWKVLQWLFWFVAKY